MSCYYQAQVQNLPGPDPTKFKDPRGLGLTIKSHGGLDLPIVHCCESTFGECMSLNRFGVIPSQGLP